MSIMNSFGWLTTLLAQTAQNTSPQDVDPLAAIGGLAALLTIVVIALAISLAIMIVVCALIHTSLKRVPVEHRKMEPGMIWLLLIPLFNMVWAFFSPACRIRSKATLPLTAEQMWATAAAPSACGLPSPGRVQLFRVSITSQGRLHSCC